MTIRQHRGDLPDLTRYTDAVAIDTETMGLNPHRDRLCVVQLSNGDGSADVVQIPKGSTDAPNLKALLANPKVTKIFHFARFDLAVLYNTFGVMPLPLEAIIPRYRFALQEYVLAPTDYHPNARAHRLIAEFILREIRRDQ